MAKIDEKVWTAVENELKRDGTASLDRLIEVGKQASSSVEKLDRRQFNARYPLQIKRKLNLIGAGAPAAAKAPRKERASKKAAEAKAPAKKRGRPAGSGRAAAARTTAAGSPAASSAATTPAASSSADRDAIRKAFLGFATQLVSVADNPKELVAFLAGVDTYVDRVARAKG